MGTTGEFQGMSAESRQAWEANGAWWDERVGAEGNLFHRQLIGPAVERLLQLQPGEQVLDCACGSGIFSRRLAQLGAQVTAFDFSQAFLERARARSTELAGRITYCWADATDRGQLLQLGEGRYDAAVCLMALMDMAEIEPLLSSLPRLLRPGGRFVFAMSHPCFNSPGTRLLSEEKTEAGQLVTEHAVKVVRYLQPMTAWGIGIIGQPEPQRYFHRPLSLLLGACFRAGLVLDGLEEPAFGPEGQPTRDFSWANFPDIPPVLAARLRRP